MNLKFKTIELYMYFINFGDDLVVILHHLTNESDKNVK